MEKTLSYYLSLPYRIEIIPCKEGGFVATVPDLPGCVTQADTEAKVLEMINDAKAAWIEDALADGDVIPEPSDAFSGKFNIRVPKSLHRDLVKLAEKESVSLNQCVTYLLTLALGKKPAFKKAESSDN